MTKEAQNALLKVLEEPPSRVIIMLLATASDKILSTIRSRVQHISTMLFDEEELTSYLCERNENARILRISSPEKLKGIVMSAGGRIGEAEMLMDKKRAAVCQSEREDIMEIVRSLGHTKSYGDTYTAMSALPQKRAELFRMLELLVSALRDMISIRHTKETRLVFFTSKDECASLSDEIGWRRIYEIYDAVCTAMKHCSMNANISNLIANLTAKIRPV